MKSLLAAFLVGATVLLAFAPGARAQQEFLFDVPSGPLSTGFPVLGKRATANVADTRGRSAAIILNVTTLTLPDADDELDFYIQTTYDGGATWTDVENVHFDTSDDGNTAKVIVKIDGTIDGPGTLLSITGTDPAAGVEISETVPANTQWRVFGVAADLVTDSTAPVRTVDLVVDDGSVELCRTQGRSTQDPSVTRRYLAFNGAFGGSDFDSRIFLELPSSLIAPAGFRLRTVTAALVAGDNFGAPQLSVEAWHDPRISTDGTIGGDLRSYDRPLGSQIRIKTVVTGATAPTYAYSARGTFGPT